MISVELNNVFKESVRYAKENRHEYLTLEHIFLSILQSEEGGEILSAVGGDIGYMMELIEAYLHANTPVLEPKDEKKESEEPYETVVLSSVMNDMMMHLNSSGRIEAKIGDMIASMFTQDKSYAYAVMQAEGIDRIDVLEVISHVDLDDNEMDDEDEEEEEEHPNLSDFTIELVAVARKGKIDPVVGRESEIDRVMQTLCRRKKNNPLLVGEPGVGKTAIAEGLALRIAEDDVPSVLKDSKIFALDLGAMISGTKYRGDFEKRLKGVLSELQTIDRGIIFIDEIHTLVGAGATSGGSMDAANLLKPALARGELKCIGATTYAEFRNHLDKDKALTRRFSKIDIDEPSVADTMKILQGIKHKYEEHHKINFSDEALQSAIDLSVKYLHDRFLPDKAMDIIDEVGAHYMLRDKKDITIESADIEESVARMLKLPSTVVSSDDTTKLKSLADDIKTKIIGQDGAIDTIVKSIKRSYAGLNQESSPIGSFLFVGPTGVGKTALSIELANSMDINFERLDMSEYMEKHALSRLIGAPPGYVGYEQGGLLTEMIKRNPHTVLLLDEVEKAHPDIMNILLQVMDGAKLTDNNGVVSDFKNVILIMTSNLGTKEANVMGFNKDTSSKTDTALKGFFTPEFRNRLSSVVEFGHLNMEAIIKIVDTEIAKLNKQMATKGIVIKLNKKAREYIAKEGYSDLYGAREVVRVIDQKIKEALTDAILFGELKDGGLVKVTYKEEKLDFVFNI
ncbi:ATP-dependent Clp protease ATP-binding subunit ClpA [Sulfurovum sp. bin170]|uniref:ATP-dependent Clp protease ATP-binding subunit ClpA n=1 Tax=Sulfurovum sp. bin170 TaxID=2695268 RepID=UPI0013DF6CF7|nr:ATP-dependent Clp protease ATP-binding subunit ClpA [Sulfurovum sp. bin170]NEW59892.1 ATP-dependent Clp protease ATP-binding subunit ClpA [Sulfurovum sp. bin170]